MLENVAAMAAMAAILDGLPPFFKKLAARLYRVFFINKIMNL
jgi:hypothetical protein